MDDAGNGKVNFPSVLLSNVWSKMTRRSSGTWCPTTKEAITETEIREITTMPTQGVEIIAEIPEATMETTTVAELEGVTTTTAKVAATTAAKVVETRETVLVEEPL